MIRILAILCGLILFSCSIDENEPEKDEERQTLKIIEDQEGTLDLVLMDFITQTYHFSINLLNDGSFKGLFPVDTLLLDSIVRQEIFLNEFVEPNMGPYWYKGYLDNVSKIRFKVKVSGEIQNILKTDKTSGLNPFKTKQISLVKNCPISYTLKDVDKNLVNSAWRLLGLTDESGAIIVHPTCEYNFIPLVFSDNFVQLQPGTDNSTIRSYHYQSGVWVKDLESSIFGYTLLEENKIKIYFEFRPYNGWRNAFTNWNNLLHVTKDIAYIDKQLKSLFKHDDMLDYEIDKNLLRLKNRSTGVYAVFVEL
jgi:hypothetical protein